MPQEDECIDVDELLNIIAQRGREIAIIFLSGIQFYTGQLFDMERITEAGHKQVRGAHAGLLTIYTEPAQLKPHQSAVRRLIIAQPRRSRYKAMRGTAVDQL